MMYEYCKSSGGSSIPGSSPPKGETPWAGPHHSAGPHDSLSLLADIALVCADLPPRCTIPQSPPPTISNDRPDYSVYPKDQSPVQIHISENCNQYSDIEAYSSGGSYILKEDTFSNQKNIRSPSIHEIDLSDQNQKIIRRVPSPDIVKPPNDHKVYLSDARTHVISDVIQYSSSSSSSKATDNNEVANHYISAKTFKPEVSFPRNQCSVAVLSGPFKTGTGQILHTAPIKHISGALTQFPGPVNQLSGQITHLARPITQVPTPVAHISNSGGYIACPITQVSGLTNSIGHPSTKVSHPDINKEENGASFETDTPVLHLDAHTTIITVTTPSDQPLNLSTTPPRTSPSPSAPSRDTHVCPECGRTYSTSSNLARHR